LLTDEIITTAWSDSKRFRSITNFPDYVKNLEILDGDFYFDTNWVDEIINKYQNADLKVFLVATAQERARRRVRDYEKLGQKINYDEVLKEIIARDRADMERETSPLIKAQDAKEIDTTILGIEDVENIICEMIEKTLIDKIIR
jgi:cytidylate kinase